MSDSFEIVYDMHSLSNITLVVCVGKCDYDIYIFSGSIL